MYIRYFWQGHHQIYGHIRFIYTVLANPKHVYTKARIWWFGVCVIVLFTVRYYVFKCGQSWKHLQYKAPYQ